MNARTVPSDPAKREEILAVACPFCKLARKPGHKTCNRDACLHAQLEQAKARASAIVVPSAPVRVVLSAPDFVRGLGAVILAASKDVTRTHLNAVRIRVYEGNGGLRVEFAATNGHWAVRCNVLASESSGATGEILVPLALASQALKAVRALKLSEAYPVTIAECAPAEGSETPQVSIAWVGGQVSGPIANGTFPPLDQAFPAKYDGPTVPFALSCAYLTDIGKSAEAWCDDRKTNAGVVMSATGKDTLDPVRFATGKPDWEAILMPMRI